MLAVNFGVVIDRSIAVLLCDKWRSEMCRSEQLQSTWRRHDGESAVPRANAALRRQSLHPGQQGEFFRRQAADGVNTDRIVGRSVQLQRQRDRAASEQRDGGVGRRWRDVHSCDADVGVSLS